LIANIPGTKQYVAAALQTAISPAHTGAGNPAMWRDTELDRICKKIVEFWPEPEPNSGTDLLMLLSVLPRLLPLFEIAESLITL